MANFKIYVTRCIDSRQFARIVSASDAAAASRMAWNLIRAESDQYYVTNVRAI